MHPGTIINDWLDMSAVQNPAVVSSTYRPLIMIASSFDKGPEKLTRTYGTEFYDLFGTKALFSKHGQPAIQAARIVDAGAEVLVKRIVAEDATLANLVLIANLTSETVQKKDENGNLLYYDADGAETTTVTDQIVVDSTVNSVKWEAVSVEGCQSFDEVKEAALAMMDVDAKKFPLIIVADNGRGVSTKSIRLTADYNTSKGYGTMFYTLRVFEGTTEIEKKTVSLNPDVVIGGISYGVSVDSSKQIIAEVDSDVFNAYVEAAATLLGVEVNEALTYDLVNMKNFKGVGIEGATISDDSFDLNADYGIALKDGTNGAFGDAPFGTEEYNRAMISFFSGEDTDEIYDLDIHKVCAIFDANYSVEVKEAIAALVNFRKDMFFFRDLGVGLFTYFDIVEALTTNKTKSKFIADYMTSYQIYEPNTHKRVEVTMMYDFAPAMVRLFATGAHVPCAGIINGMILESAIKGTVNFVPRKTPASNQLDLLEELRVNYAIFEDSGNCVVQTLYTAYEANTQLMYINNVLAVQEVVRAIRTSCPKHRYSFQSGNDFSEYAETVNGILKAYKSNFSILQFGYEQDDLLAQQKIFYGVLYFAFNNWFQTEIFDVVIINSEDQIAMANAALNA